MSATTTGFELRGERTPLRVLLRDLWNARALIQTLAKKDFFVRYRRASLGMLWAIGLPLVQAVVLAVIFSRITRFETGVRYPVFVLWGVLPWTFFSSAVTAASGAVVDGSGLATKTYFPRSVLPLVSVWSNFRGYLPAVAIMLGVAAAFGVDFAPRMLLIIPAMILSVLLAGTFALVLAAAHVYFRDTRFIVQAVILPWFWASGILYPLRELGTSVAKWLQLNPAVGMIELYRAGIGAAPPDWERAVLACVVWVVALAALALVLYRRFDRVFVDLL